MDCVTSFFHNILDTASRSTRAAADSVTEYSTNLIEKTKDAVRSESLNSTVDRVKDIVHYESIKHYASELLSGRVKDTWNAICGFLSGANAQLSGAARQLTLVQSQSMTANSRSSASKWAAVAVGVAGGVISAYFVYTRRRQERKFKGTKENLKGK